MLQSSGRLLSPVLASFDECLGCFDAIMWPSISCSFFVSACVSVITAAYHQIIAYASYARVSVRVVSILLEN